MKQLIALLISASAITTGVAANYLTGATLTQNKDENTLQVDVRVVELVDKNGQQTERLISKPRIITAPGVPASLFVGPQPSQKGYQTNNSVDVDAYQTNESINVDVSWPYPNESGTAFCDVTIKLAGKVVSQSKMQWQILGPGRTPLVVTAQDVDPKSVRAVDEKSVPYILLEFSGKTKAEVKKLANENYGNKVQVRDLQGRVTEGGLSFGTYHEIGMVLQYKSTNEAEHVAGILRGDDSK